MNKLNVIAQPGMHEVTITREFDAPRDLVFKAYTDPALVPQWWGFEGITTTVDKMDTRPGGQWRYIQSSAQGEYGFNGVYHEVSAPRRLVYTFEFEPMAGHILLETITFEELEGNRTRMIDSSVFQTVADRDGMIASGMEFGATQSMDRLEELLKTL